MSTVVILKPTYCYFWLKNRYKCVYGPNISFQGSFKLCVKSHFLLYHLSLDPLAVELVLTKCGCSDGNNNLFGYLKSVSEKQISVWLQMPNSTPKWFQFRFTYYLSLGSFHDLLLSLHNKDRSGPWLTRAILLWRTGGRLVCLLWEFSEVNCYIQSPKSMLHWGFIILTLYNLAVTPFMHI